MKNRKKVLLLFLVCMFALCLSGCNKSESERYLQFLQRQGLRDNSQHYWQNSGLESVQISTRGTFISEVKDKYDKTLYQIEDGKYKKIAEQAYQFFEFEGKVYYYNSDNKIYCYDIKTENTAVVFSVGTNILWIGLYNKNIVCARRKGIFNNALEFYTLDGKKMRTYSPKSRELGRIVQIGRFLVFLEDIRIKVYDLENETSHYLICEDGLSDSYMVSAQDNLYISIGRYVIEGNYNTKKADSRWNGLWKISLKDMEMDKWKLTKISTHPYSKFYCVGNRLFDEKFVLIE